MATAKKAAAKTAPAKTAPAKKAAAKAAAPAAKSRANSAFMKPMTPSAALAAVIGSKAMPRTEVTRQVWAYIKKNGLQDKNAKTMINADAKLKAVLGKDQVSMFEMTKIISGHLK